MASWVAIALNGACDWTSMVSSAFAGTTLAEVCLRIAFATPSPKPNSQSHHKNQI
jgi:hypothetical protein